MLLSNLNTLFLSNTTVNYYLNPLAQSQCDSICETCFGSSGDTCYSCNYYSLEQYSCGKCANHCANCIGSALNDCLLCEEEYIFTEKLGCALDLDCPKGHYPDSSSGECEKCHYSCEECTGSELTECFRCAEGYSMNNDVCGEKCPSFKYEKERECKSCDVSCLSCTGPGDRACTRCRLQEVLFQGRCIESCPGTTYKDEGNECQDCDPQCRTCYGRGNTQCSECCDECIVYKEYCLQECLQGMFRDGDSCVNCLEHCVNCFDLGNCTECQLGHHLKNGTCEITPDCPAGKYFNGADCDDCHANCELCYGGSEFECFSCKSDYFFIDSSCSEVKVKCTREEYSTSKNTCEECEIPCLECGTSEFCTKCGNGLVLSQGKCIGECPMNSYLNNTECFVCSAGCLDCEALECVACGDNYTLFDGDCWGTCPNFTYFSESLGTCDSCGEHCRVCDGDICFQCSKGAFLSNSTCEPCPFECSSCLVETACIECKEGYYLKEDLCIEDCGKEYEIIGNTCRNCPPRCLTCQNSTCSSCSFEEATLSRHTLSSGQCLEKTECIEGMSLNTNKVCALNGNSDTLRDILYGSYYIYRAFSV